MSSEQMISVDATPLYLRKRYLIVFLAFLGYVNLYTMRVDLSVAIVALTENRTVMYDDGSIVYEQYFNWNSKERGVALSAFFYGYITTQFIGGYIASKFSGRMVFGMGILGTSIMTCCTPILCYQGIYYLYLARIVVGICSGLSFPAVNAVYSRWSTPMERSRIAAFGISGIYVGAVIAMVLSGWLATTYSWEWIFYVFGCVGLMWCLLWFVIVRDSPMNDSYMKESERDFIVSNLRDQELCSRSMKTPWLAIFTSMPVYAVSVAHFAYSWGYYTLLTQLPSYMRDIVDFDLTKSGLVSAIPYLVLTILLLPSGYLADWFQINNLLSTSQVRKFFNNTSFFAQMVFLLLAGYFTNSVQIVTCITLSIGLGAFSMSGFLANTLDIAPQFSSIVLGFSNSIATLPGLISPVITGYIVQTPSDAEYKIIFFIASGIYLIGIFFYAIYATGKVQPWALPAASEMQVVGNSNNLHPRDDRK